MKYLPILMLFLGFQLTVKAQQDIEIIKVKNEDKSVDVSVKNHTDIAYTIRMNFELEGMKVEKDYPSAILVAAKSTKKVGKLIPTGPVTKYKVKYSATPENETSVGYIIEEPNIVFYSKNNQKKSTQVRLYLDKHDYDYREFNASYDKQTKEIYKAMLKRRGLNPKEVKLPVIIHNGEVHYNMENMTQFLEKEFPSKSKKKK